MSLGDDESLAAELEDLSYRDLQQRAKAAGLRSSGKTEELIQRILDHETGGGSQLGSAAPSRTPRTARKSAPTPLTSRSALLRAAAKTPLPAGQRPEEEEEREVDEEVSEQEEEERQPQPRTGLRQRSVQQQQHTQPSQRAKRASLGLDSATKPGHGAAKDGSAAPVFWVLLLTAMVAAVAALAVPFCQQNDCMALVHNLPAAVSAASADLYSRLRVQALSTMDTAHDQFQTLLTALGQARGSSKGSGACRFDAVTALTSILPEGEDWRSLHAAASAVLGSWGREPADKAAVALFVCEVPADCQSALSELDAAAAGSSGGDCVLHIDGERAGEDRGMLQRQIAEFLLVAPTGVVVIQRIDLMSPELVPVLISALSEQGAFQHDGQPVPTTSATFLLTSLMPGDVFNHVNDDIKFAQDAKNHMVVDLALRAADKVAASTQAKALRRRIDFVLPVGSDPFWASVEEEQEEDAEQAGEGCHLNATAVVNALLPEGDSWDGLREGATTRLGSAEGRNKAAAAVFVCEVAVDCQSTADTVEAAVSGPNSCLMRLEGSDMRALQEQVEQFFAAQPSGILLLDRLDQVPPDVLNVLVDVLSGPTTATVVATALLPGDVFEHVDEEQQFARDAVAHMVAEFKRKATNRRTAGMLAQAFQQRVDHWLPVGADPADIEAAAEFQQEFEQGAAYEAEEGAPLPPEEGQAGDDGAADYSRAAEGDGGVYADQEDRVAEAVVRGGP